MPAERQPERRKHVRLCPKGTVSIRTPEFAVRGRLANVSNGGLCATTLITAPDRVRGSAAELEVRFDTQESAWLRISGKILRIGPTSIAVGFDGVPSGFALLIDHALTDSNRHGRVLSLVIVDATTERRLRMAEAFRAAGCAVVDVSTPLEAIVRLGEFHFEPDVIAIADSLPAIIAEDLRTFVGHEHPRAKLITIGDGVIAPEGIAHWLSSLDPSDDLGARVRELLTRPVRR